MTIAEVIARIGQMDAVRVVCFAVFITICVIAAIRQE